MMENKEKGRMHPDTLTSTREDERCRLPDALEHTKKYSS